MAQQAICVGINHFKKYPQFQLNGCVNDANDMVAMLQAKWGFAPAEITLLTDAKATKAAILKALKAAVAAAKKGRLDRLVFTWSSHGTQITDTSGDEPDGMDEAFVPYDVAEKNGDWDPAHIITDDELHDLFQQLPGKVLLEVFLDTCHSGSGLRGAEFSLHAPRAKFVAPPSRQGVGPLPAVRGFALKRAVPAAEAPATNQVLWSGCKANQTSADAYFGGRYNGAFTYYWLQAMKDTGYRATRDEVAAKMRAAMKGRFSQVPQLEANATNRKTVVVK